MLKNIILLVLLAGVGWLGYVEVKTNGWPWDSKVTIIKSEYSRSRRSGGVRVVGQVQNNTARARTAQISCILQTDGTVKPKNRTEVQISARNTAYFEMNIPTSHRVREMECKVEKWR